MEVWDHQGVGGDQHEHRPSFRMERLVAPLTSHSQVTHKCVCAEVQASIPDALDDMDTEKPSWLPEGVLWLGPEGWMLPKLISSASRHGVNQSAADEEEEAERSRRESERRINSGEFQEQLRTGTVREQRAEVQDRAEEDIQCSACGGLEEPIVICEGGDTTSKYHTGLHTHPKIGWHPDCMPEEVLEVSLEEIDASPEDLSWCCKPCSIHLASQNLWLAWKIKNQRQVGHRQVYTVQWLGSQPDSDQYFSDLRSTTVHREWVKLQRAASSVPNVD